MTVLVAQETISKFGYVQRYHWTDSAYQEQALRSLSPLVTREVGELPQRCGTSPAINLVASCQRAMVGLAQELGEEAPRGPSPHQRSFSGVGWNWVR